MNQLKIDKACQYIIANAYPKFNKKFCGNCAKAVRLAVEHGFEIKLGRTLSAKDYGPFYDKVGFKIITSCESGKTLINYKPLFGDIAIIKYDPHGHISMFTNKGWVSDYIQIDYYGGPIRKEKPAVSIYRIL